ncbi:MAG: hypothetical protein CL693_04635 [Cellvibrionaceae bacterium]|nr:hypothetical protein [Cellvibrionaceae bacterium]|tara:strand:- start:20750 stop:21661 length:912 start_codon:yes stop_codon:yes gene_type:complete
MNEIQRQQYLDAMGIDTYMPRWILPAAASPFSCQPVLPESESQASSQLQSNSLPVAAAESALAESQNTSAAATPAASASMASAPATAVENPSTPDRSSAPQPPSAAQDVLSSVAAEPKPSASNKPVSADSILQSLSNEKRPDPRFALSLWRVSDELMVIDSRHSELALPTEPLLLNILSALGFPRQPLPKVEVLRWPMFENSYEPQGQAVARETLQAILEAMLEKQPCKYLLLMGAEACHYLLGDDQLGEGFDAKVSIASSLGRSFSLEALSAAAIVVPSLSDILQQPELKRRTWQAIQPLRQ